MKTARAQGSPARQSQRPGRARLPGPPVATAGAGKAQGGTVPIQPRASPARPESEPGRASLEPRACRGFSLVEVVISLAILSVGLVGAMRVFPVGLRASHRSELSSRAGILAQRTVESLKLVPWEELREGDTTTQEDDFEVTTRITQPAVEGLVDAARLKAVNIVVTWTQDGHSRELVVVTYLRRPVEESG